MPSHGPSPESSVLIPPTADELRAMHVLAQVYWGVRRNCQSIT